MSTTAERHHALQGAVSTSLHELADDAQTYLDNLKRLEVLPPESDDYQDVMADMHVMVTTLMVHATSTNDLLHDVDDATQDDDE